jgi:hypothetical protein
MAYLDLTPMLQAMRARPSEFEMQGSYLRHMPSHHLLNFDIWGNARVHARCDCAMLDVSREQSEEIKAAIAAWKVVYWEPHLAQIEAEKRAAKINREFSAHFQPPGLWQRFLALFRRNDDRFGLIFEEEAVSVSEETSRPAGASETTRTERRELIQN